MSRAGVCEVLYEEEAVEGAFGRAYNPSLVSYCCQRRRVRGEWQDGNDKRLTKKQRSHAKDILVETYLGTYKIKGEGVSF